MLLTDHDQLYAATTGQEEQVAHRGRSPPTYMKTNEVTQIAQDLVDT